MVRAFSFLVAATLLGTTAAPAAVRDWPARGFDKVDLAAAATVRVHAGADFAVHADGDADLIDRLDMRVTGGTLVIGWIRGQAPHNIRNERLTVTVTMPRVAAATVSGAGTVTVDRAAARGFSARVGGAGTLRVTAVETDQASLDVSGAGTLELGGRADRVVAHLSGTGSIKAAALTARSGLIEMSGVGSVTARVDGPVDVRLSGLGSVSVLGRAQCAIHKSGFGSVRCGG